MMKQVFLSLIVILAVASLAGVATYADFSDVETSQGNYFATGSLELQLGDYEPYPPSAPYSVLDEDYGEDPLGDSVEATWDFYLGYGAGGMQPGQTLAGRVKLQNFGTIEATSLDISCHNENTAPPEGPLDKDTKMIITSLLYHNGGFSEDLLQWLKIETGKPTVTLDDLESHPITGLTPPELGKEAFLDMVIEFDENTPFDPPGPDVITYQGCSTNMTLNFALQ